MGCGSRPQEVLILCPLLLCIDLPALHLPHPVLQLLPGWCHSQGAPGAWIFCRSGRAVNRGVIECCVGQRRRSQLTDCAATFTGVEVTQKKKNKQAASMSTSISLKPNLFTQKFQLDHKGLYCDTCFIAVIKIPRAIITRAFTIPHGKITTMGKASV